ncbi:tumor necrosis factor ligand superfamily member 14-like isoform X2 [Chelmon rostratus]|nr:tumor necrosis factor ligand superfamily member 14-like isoform X2 [Chelmon rostratus]XP_041789461.1 tumor necrosis factor ligand superfamily member 14-like isoform X2 [Chelmon rostratus]XP_041789462.1 tumor necrosis factor ligand superfamily member 14-like isoform X2 [Chelmon rostratus]XP_041789463.1 tumor necrosis factor ligand superfamily member 14-like isoform X2 [Chelmon rostratus]XP_041789464.1 tumor necrosis factor ligand superfamily member 14-like isoform X2 [Chelmon rostratus]XP_04
MAERGVGACPQVFVVDSQANYTSVPGGKKPRWARAGQKFLLLLVGLTVLGLVVEGYLIYNLYKKTEAFSLCMSHPLCQNLSSPKTSGRQGGTLMSRVGPYESNEIPTVRPHVEQDQQRPFAQLIGSGSPIGENNVVQWVHKGGETITYNMGYNNGRLLVEKDGHYYLYCKVTLNAAEECSLIQHKVMKVTKAYDNAIELMKSKSFRCRTPKPSTAKSSGGDDLWNSFLAGIFHLQKGDEIFVTLEDIQKMRPGTTDNLMGAFMISP